ncbi:MAG: hypothetical protein H8E32_12615 [Nitrospinae bacterium]|nr:hypothetical protein [Nitrospinota bacterium]
MGFLDKLFGKIAKDESHQRIHFDEGLCDKCGSSDFEYDSSWNEYSCKSCGWIVQNDKNIPEIQKEIKDGSNQRIHFNFLIVDYDHEIPENKWYQKSTQENKYFFNYRGTRSSDWKWAEDGKLKVAGISHGTRTLDFMKLAFLDDFKMYLEDEPDNPVDPNAKKIMASGTIDGELVSKHIGYLPKGISKKYAGVEIDIQPTDAFLPKDYNLNVGVEIGLFVRSARYLKKQAKK